MNNRLFAIAGEQSGDLLGGRLLHDLHLLNHTITFHGVGGPKMIAEGLQPILGIENLQVMGITDVLKALPRLYNTFQKIKSTILKTNPAVVVFIDYADFNMRLAHSLRKNGYKGKLVHYVSPSVWAWRKGRVNSLARTLDLLLTIFPFEERYYSKTHLRVAYVGHPLLQTVAEHVYDRDWRIKNHILPGKILSIFPGSRFQEVKLNLPLQLQVAKEVQKKNPEFQIVVSCARAALKGTIEEIIDKLEANARCVPGEYSYELMKESSAALATSGTVTLELALHETPTVMTYKLSLLNYLLGRYVLRIKLPYFCIVNILMEKEVFPEFVHQQLSPLSIEQGVEKILQMQETIQKECRELQAQLFALPANHSAPALLQKLFDSNSHTS